MIEENPLAMSDEDFQEALVSGKLDEAEEASGSSNEEGDTEEEETPTEDTKENIENPDNESDGDTSDESESEESEESDDDDDDDDDDDTHEDDDQDSDDDDDTLEKENVDEDDNDDKEDLKEKVFEPLKVSGRKINIRSIDHLRSLAQQGANASRTLNKLKDAKRIAKTLESVGLTGSKEAEQNLNLLIDAYKGEPGAIATLMQKHDIDPMDFIDEDDIQDYSPKNNILNDKQAQLQEVVDELQKSEYYSKLFSEVESFDEESKQKLFDTPDNLIKLHDDIASGVYDAVIDEIDYLNSIGQMPNGTSQLEQYIYAAQQMAAAQMKEPNMPKSKKTKTVKRKVNKGSMRQTKGKSTGSGSNKVEKEINFLTMSDDEFQEYVKKEL